MGRRDPEEAVSYQKAMNKHESSPHRRFGVLACVLAPPIFLLGVVLIGMTVWRVREAGLADLKRESLRRGAEIARVLNDRIEAGQTDLLDELIESVSKSYDVNSIIVAAGQPQRVLASNDEAETGESLASLGNIHLAGRLVEAGKSQGYINEFDSRRGEAVHIAPLVGGSGYGGRWNDGAVAVAIDIREPYAALTAGLWRAALGSLGALSAMVSLGLVVAWPRRKFAVREEGGDRAGKADIRSAARSDYAGQYFANAIEGLVVVDGYLRIIAFNPMAEQISGYASAGVMGRCATMLMPEADANRFIGYLKQGQADRFEFYIGRRVEILALKSDGTVLPIEASTTRIEVDGKQAYAVTVRDIDERVKKDEELQNYYFEVEAARVRTERQALEIVKQAEELAAARNTAVEAARMKSEFLANMSHEIRTPLNGIIGMTDLLIVSALDADQADCAQTVKSCGEALLEIITDILDFSKAEAGKIELESIDFDLRSCIEAVGDMLAPKAQAKGLELAILINSQVPERVKGDPARIRQIVINLVNNAIKFTDKGDVLIEVKLEADENGKIQIRCEVTDTGIGIPEDRMHRLFESFSQVDASTTRKYGGSGLGLAICLQFTELMGGEIGVESTEGEGSTFWFTIALDRADSPGERSGAAEQAEIDGRRILIVDANATMRRVVARQLESCGCVCESAADSAAALALLKSCAAEGNPFDAMLVDFLLPCGGAEGFAKRVAEEGASGKTLMLLLTSVPKRGDAKRVAEAGFAAYLTKPVKHEVLRSAIATALGIQPNQADGTQPEEIITRHTLRTAERNRRRLLLVEDNAVNQKVAVRFLSQIGYPCDVAANGIEALEALEVRAYDLVLMDCQMPEMDGFEATKRIREREDDKSSVPIVAMTAHVLTGDRERCIAAGMDEYLAKPVNMGKMSEVIDRLLSEVHEKDSTSQPEIAEPGDVTDEPKTEARRGPIAMDHFKSVSDGDAEFELELITQFLSDSAERVNALRTAASEADRAAICEEAHRLKGSSANIGAEGLRDIAGQVEIAALDNGGIQDVGEKLSALEDELANVKSFFESYVPS